MDMQEEFLTTDVVTDTGCDQRLQRLDSAAIIIWVGGGIS